MTRRRLQSVLVPVRCGTHLPSRAGATESVRGRIKTLAPGRQRWSVQGASLEETKATGSSGSSDAGLLGEEPESHLGYLPKLEARRQARFHSIMPLVRPRPDGERGSSLHLRKTVGRVIRESSDPWGARDVGRLQTLEGRIFPSGARQAARPRSSAQGQLDAAAPRGQRESIRGG